MEGRAARVRRRAVALAAAFAAIVSLSLASAPAPAAEQGLVLEPAKTSVRFTLGATLHSVEGRVVLERGELRFDPDAGTAAGKILLDARSAETGLARRDANMHRDVLESAKFPTIAFAAEGLEVVRRDEASAELSLVGSLTLHGETRPFAIPASLEARGPGRIAISAAFRVPYVDWGMVDYSTFVLRVDRFVDVTLEAEARLEP